MKYLVLLAAVSLSPIANAYTFCTNSVPKTGANFIFLLSNACPADTSKIHGMSSAHLYKLEKSNASSCVYHSSTTRATGDEMYCETHLSAEQTVRAIKKSGLRKPGLMHIVADLKRRFATAADENPAIYPIPPQDSYDQHLDTGYSEQVIAPATQEQFK
jgi:hypothetical protein